MKQRAAAKRAGERCWLQRLIRLSDAGWFPEATLSRGNCSRRRRARPAPPSASREDGRELFQLLWGYLKPE